MNASRECFWPLCSDHKRCDTYGSCVALAQREAIAAGDFPGMTTTRPPQPQRFITVGDHDPEPVR